MPIFERREQGETLAGVGPQLHRQSGDDFQARMSDPADAATPL
jgi:hypothetical protein